MEGIMHVVRNGWTVSFLLGAVCGGMLSVAMRQNAVSEAYAQPPSNMAAEVELIKGRLPDQAHAMQDVGYHFSNTWFAGQHEHWELANFYLAETKSHLRWAVRIIPKRKDKAGQEIDLQSILQATENGPLTQLQEAIAAKDKDRFVAAYKFTLETCYACHKASDKPFLRPQIPTQPETHIINFDPQVDWPK
jgi:hypothetical protein